MEHWDRNAGWDRDMLEHIVALLFALAELADLAAGAPFLRRRQMLGILSHGEAEARAFVIGVVTGTPVDAPETADDAANLASRLRALALALCVLMARSALFASPGAAVARASQRMAVGSIGLQAPPPVFDTS